MIHPLKPALLTLMLAALPGAAQESRSALPYLGFNPAWMDVTAKPCSDFYQYALGGWLRTAAIPAEYPFASVDVDVNERIQGQVKAILEAAALAEGAAGPTRRVGDFYAAAMDEAAVEKAGLAPLKPLLADIEGMRHSGDLAGLLGRLHRVGVGAGFAFSVGQDDRRSTEVVPQLAQDGLGLPERDYYLREDAEAMGLRARYEGHVATMLGFLGEPDPKGAAAQVVQLERRMAEASRGLVALRDPVANYHRMSLPELATAAPGVAWSSYFSNLGLPEPGPLVVRQPEFLAALGRWTQEVPLRTWQAYLRWQVIRAYAPALNRAVGEEAFAFYGKALSGTEAQRPRWKRTFSLIDGLLGEDLGQLYVAKHFPPEAKAKVTAMVQNLKVALRARLEGLAWMEPTTKREALRKLESFQVKVGYPDRFRDYGSLRIQRDDFFGNVLRARSWEFQRNLAKVGKPLDRGEWSMTPQTNNAEYNPSLNAITFPAGILQHPYFDLRQDDATNYGNIGATIGHEMTHGFDDQGRLYDAEGNLRDWWTAADAAAYNLQAAKVVAQFDAFEALPGVAVNGKATLGENIADLGGLLLAWDAWRMTLRGKPEPGSVAGFPAVQRFFLGYAETWRMKARPEYLKLQVATDVHAPARFRVMGPLANLPEFFEAFGCPEGAPMRRDPKARPSIW